jgi:hypothetical protein
MALVAAGVFRGDFKYPVSNRILSSSGPVYPNVIIKAVYVTEIHISCCIQKFF